jgi:hypothetical protein
MNHTPLPWQLSASGFTIEPDQAPRYELNDGWNIAICEYGPDAKANAAYIVRCVNSHAALVELAAAAQAVSDMAPPMPDPVWMRFRRALIDLAQKEAP